jgi:ribose-phosphate pyrophosphokinase
MILFTTQAYAYMLPAIIESNAAIIAGAIEIKVFPDEETYHRIITDVSNKDVVIIGGTINDAATLELFDIAISIATSGANSLKIFIPYFGYSTMERAVKNGEVVKAKNRALLLSAIPTANVPTKIYLFDLHSEGIPYYFESNVHATHIYCKQLIIDAILKLGGNNFVLAATDAGRAKWVESLANEMKVSSAFIYKNRLSATETEVVGINADVQDKNVVIYDDMIRTGGSLMKAAAAYRNKGANKIFVVTTHGMFSNNALDKIAEQGIIEKIICTNSHASAIAITHPILEVINLEKMIAAMIVD